MAYYGEGHADPKGPGDARPTAMQIIKDEGMGGKLAGKVVVITGVSSGIGIETARALGTAGATLYLTARDLPKAKVALRDFFDPSRMELVQMEQTSLTSVRAAAETILEKTRTINILIANAGVVVFQNLQLTDSGHELHLATNHLSHFLFFQLLKPALLTASSPDFQSRVVMVASSGHRRRSGLNPSDNYHFQNGDYEPNRAYSQSKLANIYMANEIERRYGSVGLHALSVHPGAVATAIGRHLPVEVIQKMAQNQGLLRNLKDIPQGAATTVWAAVSKGLEGKGGLYLSDCSVAEEDDLDESIYSGKYASYAFNPDEEARLWKDSLEMVGLPKDE
ncbi:NAD(P)-binding protein [Penicillium cinerascens]|uniref:NAD(P)-binding protein n=1 Tax=Penicillium cinerascens TaxID=70096 RepID=A0A9W9M5Z1_9EURO|nr:NAD(P)-binding protein [Penicillium cinerascens]KAJ5190976.1 NAD(P)-binding protein [Penicillium cinerascens]